MSDFYYIKKKATVAKTDYTVAVTTTGNGTWTVPAGVSTLKHVLVVGSGGVGGGSGGGGGGAQVSYFANYGVTPSSTISYHVASGQTYTDGTTIKPGWSSTFSGITAVGGGGGGNYQKAGGNGACGGGGGRTGNSNVGRAGGTGSVGGNGGSSPNITQRSGGGGGGMSSAGSNGSGDDVNNSYQYPASSGGTGIYYGDIFGTAVGDAGWFGGGGSGYWQGYGYMSPTATWGKGGKGGGGQGVNNGDTQNSGSTIVHGKANTGGGGGAFGNGGSGVIIFIYEA